MIKKRLIILLSKSRKYVYLQVLWQWLSLICQIVLIFTVADLLQHALVREWNGSVFLRSMVIVMITIVLRVLFDKQATNAGFQASVDVKRILREKIYQKLLRLGASYREQVSTSEVVQMSVEGVEQLEVYFGRYLSQFFYSLIAPITLFLVLFRINWQASLVLLICVPLIPGVIVMITKIAKRLLSRYWSIYTGLGDSFLENLQGLTTIKIYRAEQQKAREMDAESEQFRKITMKVLSMQLNSIIVMDIIAYGGAAIGMVIALWQFYQGQTGFEGTLTIILLAAEFFLPMRLLGSFFHIAMNGMAASDKMFAFLDLPEPEEKSVVLSKEEAELELRDVGFSYHPERQILQNISMTLPKGSFTSIVGTSGCGKSTIAGILMGRNRGYQGSVRFGQQELSEVTEESLMKQITLVSCNSYLFKGTVRDNLLSGNPYAKDDALYQALEQVNLKGFVEAENGLSTEVAEGGANFSGGQRQRLAIARALLHDSPVYIFDEATSNIDVESEELIMEVVHKLAKEKTVILISHRLANVVASDRIYMLDKGAVQESGRHQELLEKNGAYAHLYRSQQSLEAYGKVVVES